MTDILFAEDDADIREWVQVALERDTCRIRAVADGAAAVVAYEEKIPDLMILDVMMPKMSGWDVVNEIRRRDKVVPILMLTAKSAEQDKVLGLGLGADDYLTKPFGLSELRARVAALLRRAGISAATTREGDVFGFGEFKVNAPRSVLVSKDGAETELTALELGILKFLAAHPGDVVSREALLNGLWGISYSGTTRTIDTRVAALRQKLGAHGSLIETVYGSGYRYRPA
ncbi:MAG: response regulator transcription factor [Kiritimatiellae bacterium]|nr:response regulator transcription factor [Kiritimatiellia bacterium]